MLFLLYRHDAFRIACMGNGGRFISLSDCVVLTLTLKTALRVPDVLVRFVTDDFDLLSWPRRQAILPGLAVQITPPTTPSPIPTKKNESVPHYNFQFRSNGLHRR